MKISGHGLKEHIRFLAPLFALIAAVWALRLILAAAGAPHRLLSVVSVIVAAAGCVVLAVVLIHIRNFGSYGSVVVSSLLLSAWGQLLVIAAILFSVLTGIPNVFTAPEFSFPGEDPGHIKHIVGHLTAGLAISSLTGAAAGCILLWLLRIILPVQSRNQVSQQH